MIRLSNFKLSLMNIYLLKGSADGTVAVLQISKKKILLKLVHSVPSSAADASSTRAAVAADAEGDDRSGDGEEEAGEEVLAVECVGFDTAGMKWAASGGSDKALKIWDLTAGSCRCTCLHDGGVVALKWHQSLPVVCTAALDAVIRLWDARSGTVLTTFTGHQDLVTDIFYAPSISGGDSTSVESLLDCIVSVSDDRTSRVFMVDSHSLFNK